MAAQLGCIYIHHLKPLLQLVFHFLDWSFAMSSYRAITRITPVSKMAITSLSHKNFLKSLLLVNVDLETPVPKWVFEM
jgi:hypothetical protein